MQPKIILTKDGSKTLHFPEWNESYHSSHGAITEALHVYIKNGLEHRILNMPMQNISVLEMGFGTGLNAYLTYKYGQNRELKITYTSIEKYPIDPSIISSLNYVDEGDEDLFNLMHTCPWEEFSAITTQFKLKKHLVDIDVFKTDDKFDVVFYDAFGPRVQPNLWSTAILQHMYDHLNYHGVWVTYCCKGSVRRDLIDIGFQVEKIPGPPGKREMLRATKLP